jgi:hypothetical protein
MGAFVDAVLDLLYVDPSGDQQFVWPAQAEVALARMLDVLFEHPTETKEGIEDLFRFVCALELELRSPKAADRLRSFLTSDPRVMEWCEPPSRSDELKKAQTRWSGGDGSKQAPVFGRSAPAGTIRASALVDPVSRRRRT